MVQCKFNLFLNDSTIMHFYGKMSSVRYTNENHIAAVFVQSVFTDYSTRAANLIASEWSYKNQNSSYWGRFQ